MKKDIELVETITPSTVDNQHYPTGDVSEFVVKSRQITPIEPASQVTIGELNENGENSAVGDGEQSNQIAPIERVYDGNHRSYQSMGLVMQPPPPYKSPVTLSDQLNIGQFDRIIADRVPTYESQQAQQNEQSTLTELADLSKLFASDNTVGGSGGDSIDWNLIFKLFDEKNYTTKHLTPEIIFQETPQQNAQQSLNVNIPIKHEMNEEIGNVVNTNLNTEYNAQNIYDHELPPSPPPPTTTTGQQLSFKVNQSFIVPDRLFSDDLIEPVNKSELSNEYYEQEHNSIMQYPRQLLRQNLNATDNTKVPLLKSGLLYDTDGNWVGLKQMKSKFFSYKPNKSVSLKTTKRLDAYPNTIYDDYMTPIDSSLFRIKYTKSYCKLKHRNRPYKTKLCNRYALKRHLLTR